MPHLIAYAWIATVVFAITVAARRGLPILHAFGWIDTRLGLWLSIAVLAAITGLAILQLATDARPWGQPPIVWAALLALVYAWVSIAHRLRRAR